MAFDPNAANVGPQAPVKSPTATSTAADPNDPFAAMGGGVKLANGAWVPSNSPLAQPGGTTTAAPVAAPSTAPSTATASTAAPGEVDPFAAMGGGVKLANGAWVPNNNPLAQQALAQQPAASGGPLGPQSTSQAVLQPGTVGGSTAQGQPTTVASSFQQALINRLNPTPVSADSAEIAPAIAANRASEQRNLEKTRATMAERAASQGLDQNAFNTQLTGAQQESAGRQSNFAGQATLGLAQQRAQDITSALALAGSSLSDADRQALQKQLAELQAQVSRESINQQAVQGNNQFTLGQGQLNLGLLNALLGNQQFGQNLGAQLGMFNSSQNNTSLQGLLNSLGG